MELRLNPVGSALSTQAANLARTATAGAASKSDGFAGALSSALKSVSDAQYQASSLQREVQLENPNVSLEQTMVSMQKAQLGFTATMTVRNRMVQAYTDIMNMQV